MVTNQANKSSSIDQYRQQRINRTNEEMTINGTVVLHALEIRLLTVVEAPCFAFRSWHRPDTHWPSSVHAKCTLHWHYWRGELNMRRSIIHLPAQLKFFHAQDLLDRQCTMHLFDMMVVRLSRWRWSHNTMVMRESVAEWWTTTVT
jgi:hypothetical protein